VKIPELRRLLAGNLDQEEWQVEDLLARLTPVLLVDDLVSGEEGAMPRWAFGEGSKTSVAGEFSRVHLQNPASSGVRLEVFDVGITTAATSTFAVGWSETELGTAEGASLANRYLGTVGAPGSPAGRVTSDSDPASGIGAAEIIARGGAASGRVIPVNLGGVVVLRPGTGIRAVGGVVNMGIECYWRWREVLEK
jgi:hypothetical protein